MAKLLVVPTYHFVVRLGTLPEKTGRHAIKQNGE
jgi:hypothetical protein